MQESHVQCTSRRGVGASGCCHGRLAPDIAVWLYSPMAQRQGSSHATSDLRRKLVKEAVKSWMSQLVDLGGRNNLLYFKQLKRGTMELVSPPLDASALQELLSGSSVRLSKLVADEAHREEYVARARTLHARAKENSEEKGLETLYIGSYLAAWNTDRSSAVPCAPVALQPLRLEPTGRLRDDFELGIVDEFEINPTFVHFLNTEFGTEIDADALVESSGGDLKVAVAELQKACSGVPGFSVNERFVVGNFSYMKLPIVRDLERSEDAIADHLLLAAIAGDPEARDELRDSQARVDIDNLSPQPPPADEFSILDTDSSQGWVIAGALAGANLVVIGPPGTGKSQTISNLVATLAARGKSVLFVAEKRAAIEAVLHRLRDAGLSQLVLDLHAGARERRKTAEALGSALNALGEAIAPDLTRLHRRVQRRRKELDEYEAQLHEVPAPWGVSAYTAQSRLIGLANAPELEARFAGKVLDSLGEARLLEGMERAEQFLELGGGTMVDAQTSHVWKETYARGQVTDAAAVGRLLEAVQELLNNAVPGLTRELASVANALPVVEGKSREEAHKIVRVLRAVTTFSESFDMAIFETDLDVLARSLAPAQRGVVGRAYSTMFNSQYRDTKTQLIGLAKDTMSAMNMLEGVRSAQSIAEDWATIRTSDHSPATYQLLDSLETAVDRFADAMVEFGEAGGVQPPPDTTLAVLEQQLRAMESERLVLARFPQMRVLEHSIREAGLGPSLDEAIAKGLLPHDAGLAFERSWLASVLDRITVDQPSLASFDSVAHTKAIQDYSQADREHVETVASRVRRAWAAHATRTRDAHPAEAALVSRQATLKRRHLPLRQLFASAPNVLTAIKPCWVMSPLVVAQVLPPRAAFDVVIFDEASQILPADAVSALLRGKQAIVAGDPHQLPPTTFFIAGIDDDDDADDEQPDLENDDGLAIADARAAALTNDRESVLDVMRTLLPVPHGTRTLSWHYRSKDERLISFSNSRPTLYDWSLTTFPGALGGPSIKHVLAPFNPSSSGINVSPQAEVQRVVELVIEHALDRPDESLGVVTLGLKHAERVEERLRAELGFTRSWRNSFPRMRRSRSSSRTWSESKETSGMR